MWYLRIINRFPAHIVICFFLFFFCPPIYSNSRAHEAVDHAADEFQHSNTRTADSLRYIIESVSLEELINLYPEIHNTLYSLDSLDLHLEFNQLFLDAARKANNKRAEALARGLRVEAFSNHRQPDSIVMTEAVQAMDFMRGDPDAAPHYFYTATIMTDILIMSGNYDEALKMAEKFYREAGDIDYASGIAGALQSMGKAYEGLGLFDKAAVSLREAIANTTEIKGAGVACESYLLLVNVLNQMGLYEEALQASKDFEAFLDRRQSMTGNPGELVNIRFVSNLCYAKTYTNLGEFAIAGEYINTAESLPPFGTVYGRFMVEEVRYEHLMAQGNYPEAERSLDVMDQSYMDNSRFHEQLRQKERRSDLYHKWGKFDRAADIYKEYIIQKDSLQRVEMATRLNTIRTLYEVDILEMQKERQKAIIRSGVILLIVILIALAVVGYFYGKTRQAYIVLAKKARQWAESDAALSGHAHNTTPNKDNGKDFDSVEDEDDEEYIGLGNKLSSYILEYKPYADPELTLERLSEMLGVSRNKLSRTINRNTGKIFKQYINELRVSEAIQLMSDPQSRSFSMEHLMELAGFKSRSAFYDSFKKVTGLTPAQYWKSIRQLLVE